MTNTGECGEKKVAISNLSQAVHHQDFRGVTGLKDCVAVSEEHDAKMPLS